MRLNINHAVRKPLVNASLLTEGLSQTEYYIGWIFSNGSIMYQPNGIKWVSIPCENDEVKYLQYLHTYFTSGKYYEDNTNGFNSQYVPMVNIPVLNGRHILRIRDTVFSTWCENHCGVTRYKKDRADVPGWLEKSPAFWRGVIDSSGIIDGDILKVLTTGKMIESITESFIDWLRKDDKTIIVSRDVINPMVVNISNLPSALSRLYTQIEGISNDIPERFKHVVSAKV